MLFLFNRSPTLAAAASQNISWNFYCCVGKDKRRALFFPTGQNHPAVLAGLRSNQPSWCYGYFSLSLGRTNRHECCCSSLAHFEGNYFCWKRYLCFGFLLLWRNFTKTSTHDISACKAEGSSVTYPSSWTSVDTDLPWKCSRLRNDSRYLLFEICSCNRNYRRTSLMIGQGLVT